MLLKEFKGFLTKSNALALAIGVIIGAAIGKVVSAISDDLIMPLVGLMLPSGDWRTAKIVLKPAAGPGTVESAILYGHLLGTIIDFLIIAAVVFAITKAFIREEPKA